MSLAAQASVRPVAQPAPKETNWFASNWGLSPNVANPKVLLGTSGGLTLAFSGFANTALVLVAAALFLAAAMTATGLDKRIALNILSRVGIETRDFVRTGLVLTMVAIVLVMVLGATYWHWLGYV